MPAPSGSRQAPIPTGPGPSLRPPPRPSWPATQFKIREAQVGLMQGDRPAVTIAVRLADDPHHRLVIRGPQGAAAEPQLGQVARPVSSRTQPYFNASPTCPLAESPTGSRSGKPERPPWSGPPDLPVGGPQPGRLNPAGTGSSRVSTATSLTGGADATLPRRPAAAGSPRRLGNASHSPSLIFTARHDHVGARQRPARSDDDGGAQRCEVILGRVDRSDPHIIRRPGRAVGAHLTARPHHRCCRDVTR